MTIFLEIAKHFLKSGIRKICEDSVAKDNGLMGRLRNLELSKKKRELLAELLQKVDCVVDQENENLTKESLDKVLEQSLNEVRRERSKFRGQFGEYTDGEVECGLIALGALLIAIYNKLEQLRMLAVDHDTEPFNCLRFHLAGYCAHMLVNSRNDALSASQEQLIIHAMLECRRELELLTAREDRAQEANQKTFGLVRETQLTNLDLYRQFNIDPGIPKRFLFLNDSRPYSEVQLGGGILGEYLRAAGEELKHNHAQLKANEDKAVERVMK